MELSSLVQSIGRSGESAYVYTLPNYAPIQPVNPVQNRQGHFDSNLGNSKNSPNRSNLSQDYKEKANQIMNDSKSTGNSIVPGMLLNLIA